MSSAGPRKYNIFICHRYKDDDLYDRLRRVLRKAPRFRYQNLSVQDDMLLSLRTEAGLKRAITAKVKRADVMLVFAHSAGRWVEHELETANRYDVPIISILDPKRLADPSRRSRSEHVTSHGCCEVSLSEDKDIVTAIRKYARSRRPAAPPEQVDMQETIIEQRITAPVDIARRITAREERKGFMARLGMLFGLSRADYDNRAP